MRIHFFHWCIALHFCFGLNAIAHWSQIRHIIQRGSEYQGCGYDACHLGQENMLNVHLIPHTHDDVGWLKTVDQYYYGANNHIQRAGVQYILDSVIQALAADSKRRFTYVEMAFFIRWWRAQPIATQMLVRKLVNNGQLQFALAGWSMADEATVHYTDAIDQLTRGHDALYRLFGECGIPRVAWQIDPFGHSRDHADLFRDVGFDAVFFQRMDYREKDYRRMSRTLEVLWETDVQPNISSQGLFTSMFYDSYCYPASFCFDDKCTDEPMRDDPEMEGYNIPQRVREFLNYVQRIRNAFATNHIMVLMGCDFTYENANVNFKNTDKLIQYVNEEQKRGSDVNLLYSTPQCYTKAVNEAFNKRGTIDRRQGDFFPYASGPNSYWTGYYTSRPSLKRFVRYSSNLLTITEQLHLFADRIMGSYYRGIPTVEDKLVDKLRQAMGVMQHHDAITGTEKEHVAHDYARILSDGVIASESLIVKAMIKLLPELADISTGHWPSFCDQLNMSLCDALEGLQPYVNASGIGGLYIHIYNPTGWYVNTTWLRLPVFIPGGQTNRVDVTLYELRMTETVALPFQLVPIPSRVIDIPERRITQTVNNMDLIFTPRLPLNPVGFSTYYLALTDKTRFQHLSKNSRKYTRNISCMDVPKISPHMSYQLHVSNGGSLPVAVIAEHQPSGTQYNITMQMFYYYGETYSSQASGAYVFLPKSKSIFQTFPDPQVTVIRGECVQEVRLEYVSWATLTVRLYSNGELETDWIAGPIPDEWRQFSRELVIRYQVKGSGIEPVTPGEFFTDSAGRRLIRRVRNQRPDWNISQEFLETQPVAGNYYPIINRIMLKGSKPRTWESGRYLPDKRPAMGFVVYTDRAQGGSSLQDGAVELMIHRRLIRDDGYGVGEALTENGLDRKGLIVRGVHRIRLDELQVIEQNDQIIATLLSRAPKPIFTRAAKPPEVYGILEWSALNVPFPPHIHLLSLIAWPLNRINANPRELDQILIRLEHMDAYSSSRPEILVMTSRFRGIRITGAREVTLTAEQDRQIAASRRLKWPTERITWPPYSPKVFRIWKTRDVIINLPPNKISTFILRYVPETINSVL